MKNSVVWYEKTLETVNKILNKVERRGKYADMNEGYEIKGTVIIFCVSATKQSHSRVCQMLFSEHKRYGCEYTISP